MLSPLGCLKDLLTLYLSLDCNSIGDIGAEYLLSFLSLKNSHANLQDLSISLFRNNIGHIGGKALLLPLAFQANLSRLSINLDCN